MATRLPSFYAVHANENPKQKQETRTNDKINYEIRIQIIERRCLMETTFYISAVFLLLAAVLSVSLTHRGVKTS